MDQTSFKVTAPNNPDPQWPEGFVAVLREAGAKEKSIPYCLDWVRRFFKRFPDRARRDLGRTEIEIFLSETATQAWISNWQVQQARDALELYYAKFRGISLDSRDTVSDTKHTAQPSRDCAHVQKPKTTYTKPNISVKSEKNPNATDPKHPTVLTEEKENKQDVERLTVKDPPKNSTKIGGENTGNKGTPIPNTGTCNWKLLEEALRDVLRTEHYAYSTERTYVGWIKRFVAFHKWRKPSSLEATDVKAYLTYLAKTAQVAGSTQNQAA